MTFVREISKAFLAPFRRVAWWLVMGPLDIIPYPDSWAPHLFGFAVGSKGKPIADGRS